jgi:hypothetical protein
MEKNLNYLRKYGYNFGQHLHKKFLVSWADPLIALIKVEDYVDSIKNKANIKFYPEFDLGLADFSKDIRNNYNNEFKEDLDFSYGFSMGSSYFEKSLIFTCNFDAIHARMMQEKRATKKALNMNKVQAQGYDTFVENLPLLVDNYAGAVRSSIINHLNRCLSISEGDLKC